MQQTPTKVFISGNSQAVRIPKQYRLDVDEVYIRQDEATGDLILSPRRYRKPDWNRFLALAEQVPSDQLDGFMDDRAQPVDADRDLFPEQGR